VPERYSTGSTAKRHVTRYDVHLSVAVRRQPEVPSAEAEQVDV